MIEGLLAGVIVRSSWSLVHAQRRLAEVRRVGRTRGPAKSPSKATECGACGELGHNKRNPKCPRKRVAVDVVPTE